ncbi:hypothetical protein M422DRAFT_97456, partial [Sphaerobolus stellatus SS14]
FVADMPGSRKTVGSSQCILCGMIHKDVVAGCLLDPQAWQRVTLKQYLDKAQKWKNAKTLNERETLYKKIGIRWSPLLRLPYWNPVKLAVVDPMHALFLNLVKIHFRETYGMDSKTVEKTQTSIQKKRKKSKIKPLDAKDLRLGEEALNQTGLSKSALKKRLFSTLQELCQERDIERTMDTTGNITKETMSLDLLNWIRKAIATTITPSWFPVVPRQFGSAKAGKLKAAEWQAVITVYAPAALCRVWGRNSDAFSTHFKFLQNTMNLVASVLLAVSYETSPLHAALYTQYMQAYLKGLKELFPTMRFRNTHHIVLHIEELLNLLGPVHSWWMFPFERLIGRLQKISTNWIIG